MKRTLITCMITSLITGMTIPHMIDAESTKTATQSRQETTTETTVNNSLNGIDMTGFETEIYYINSAEDFDRCTYAVQNRNGKIIIEVVHAVVTSDGYYGAAEPPVRCGESHLSGLTEPPQFVY